MSAQTEQKLIRVRTSTFMFSKAGVVETAKLCGTGRCVSITFINKGDDTVTLNNVDTLATGESRVIFINHPYYLDDTYSFYFTAGLVATSQNLVVYVQAITN